MVKHRFASYKKVLTPKGLQYIIIMDHKQKNKATFLYKGKAVFVGDLKVGLSVIGHTKYDTNKISSDVS